MRVRWLSFGLGMWLILLPVTLGYSALGPVLHDVGVGLLVCIATLGTLQRPSIRVVVAFLGLWLLCAPRLLEWEDEAIVEPVVGAILCVSAWVPSGKVASTRRAERLTA